MKYLHYYEHLNEYSQPKIGEYVVAYRPYRVEKDTHLDPIIFDNSEYVIEVGKIISKNKTYVIGANYDMFTIKFLTSNTIYIREKNQLLFSSTNLLEAEEYFEIMLDINKYNL